MANKVWQAQMRNYVVCVCVAHKELVPVLLFYLQANFALKTCSSVYIFYNSTCGINAKIDNKKPDACVPTRIANYFSTKKMPHS